MQLNTPSYEVGPDSIIQDTVGDPALTHLCSIHPILEEGQPNRQG